MGCSAAVLQVPGPVADVSAGGDADAFCQGGLGVPGAVVDAAAQGGTAVCGKQKARCTECAPQAQTGPGCLFQAQVLEQGLGPGASVDTQAPAPSVRSTGSGAVIQADGDRGALQQGCLTCEVQGLFDAYRGLL